MFNNLIAALAVTAFGLSAMPAKANTGHKYFAAGVLAGATCHYMNGQLTADQAAKVMKFTLTEKGIPLSYGNDPEVGQLAKSWIKTNGCDS